MKDVEVNDETLALDLIDEVGKADGDFLQTEHTARHYREDYYPELLERQNYGTWQAQGATTLRDRARKRVADVLEKHRPASLPADMSRSIRAIVEKT
jgi:trimethylamine---corrinoid protein Co-methyltransferase